MKDLIILHFYSFLCDFLLTRISGLTLPSSGNAVCCWQEISRKYIYKFVESIRKNKLMQTKNLIIVIFYMFQIT